MDCASSASRAWDCQGPAWTGPAVPAWPGTIRGLRNAQATPLLRLLKVRGSGARPEAFLGTGLCLRLARGIRVLRALGSLRRHVHIYIKPSDLPVNVDAQWYLRYLESDSNAIRLHKLHHCSQQTQFRLHK